MEYWRKELYHHGIKGMKWGVRRFQKRNGELTARGKQRYSYEDKQIDRYTYGKHGQKRIAKRMEKGYSHKQAENREFLRRTGEEVLATAAVAGIAYLALSGKGSKLINKGKETASSLLKRREPTTREKLSSHINRGRDKMNLILGRRDPTLRERAADTLYRGRDRMDLLLGRRNPTVGERMSRAVRGSRDKIGALMGRQDPTFRERAANTLNRSRNRMDLLLGRRDPTIRERMGRYINNTRTRVRIARRL